MDKRKLIKKYRKHNQIKKPAYIENLMKFRREFTEYPQVVTLIDAALAADRALANGALPPDLPKLELPADIQDQIFTHINATYAMNDPKGDAVWNKLCDALPQLDEQLRSLREYLENQYGKWAYISDDFTNELADFLNDQPALEVMAGNGYISKGLRDHHANVITTDSLDWTQENETGKHQVTNMEPLSAIDAYEKYKNQVKYVIMCWSPDGVPVDKELLDAIREDGKQVQLIVIGEYQGATNSKAFWDAAEFINTPALAALNEHYSHFDLINDQVYLIK